MMNVTFDTNCIIALEENESESGDLRRIVQSATERMLRLRVIAISASERQADGGFSENFSDFEAKIAKVGLQDVEILLPYCIWDVTYWDHCIWGSEQFAEQAKAIHEVLFPTSPFEYDAYCRRFNLDPPAARGVDRKWRNRVVDTLALWTHIHNGGGVFVTSDNNFHGSEKKPMLVRLGSGEILRPKEAAVRLCPGYQTIAISDPSN